MPGCDAGCVIDQLNGHLFFAVVVLILVLLLKLPENMPRLFQWVISGILFFVAAAWIGVAAVHAIMVGYWFFNLF